MTLGEWMTNWLVLREPELRQRTQESYNYIVTRYIVPACGAIDLDALDPGPILALLASIAAEGHTRVAELTYVVLSAALAEVRPGLMRRVPRPVHIQRMPEPWGDAEIMTYRAALVGHRQELPLSLALLCGLRRGEVCGLRWEDVDLRERTLMIRNQRQRMADGQIVDGPPKSRAGIRRIPYPDSLDALIREHWRIGGYVCEVTPQGLYRAHVRLVERLGLPPLPLHGLRHTMATSCVRHGGDLRSLQQLLGHASYTTTANRYTHPDLPMLRDALAAADDLCYTVPGVRQRPILPTVSLTLNQGVQGSSP